MIRLLCPLERVRRVPNGDAKPSCLMTTRNWRSRVEGTGVHSDDDVDGDDDVAF